MSSVLITGANRGIGLELARQYAADGWQVFATARDPNAAPDLAALAKASGGTVSVFALEVTDVDAVDRLAAALRGKALDVLINNAGVAVRDGMNFGETNPDSWARAFMVNTIAPTKVSEALLPNLLAGKGKTIGMLSSRLGSHTYNNGGYLAYRATKAALNSVVRTMAAELKDKGIMTVALHPGHVRTDMGGAAAPVVPTASAAGLRKVLAGMTAAKNGGFFDFEGNELAW